jgi:hypothetical protein
MVLLEGTVKNKSAFSVQNATIAKPKDLVQSAAEDTNKM